MHCAKEAASTRLFSPAAWKMGKAGIQFKLKVNPPHDAYEQEADRIADHVVKGVREINLSESANNLQPVPIQRMEQGQKAISRQPDEMKDEDLDEDETEPLTIQTKAAHGATPEPAADFEQDLHRSAGQPLPNDIRGRMERQIGYDLSRVRVHADEVAGGMADSIDALAFTHGTHIYFSGEQYAPQAESGLRLLTHEVVHTLQQCVSSLVVQREPKKKAGKSKLGQRKFGQRTFDPATLTDQEKINKRKEFRQEAAEIVAVMRDDAKDKPPLDQLDAPSKAKLDSWRSAVNAALSSSNQIGDPEQKQVRQESLRAFKELLEDKLYVHSALRYDAVALPEVRRRGDPTATYTAEQLQRAKTETAAMKAGSERYLLWQAEGYIYTEMGIDPKELRTEEQSEEEAGGAQTFDQPAGGGATGGSGGTTAPKRTVEDRNLLETFYSEIGDIPTQEGPIGDEDLLFLLLKQLSDEERKDFVEFVKVNSREGANLKEKSMEELLDVYQQLSPGEREVMKANRELRDPREEEKDVLSGKVLLDIKQDARTNEQAAAQVKQLASNLNLIRSALKDPNDKKQVESLDSDTAAFFNEIAMLQGLLVGAGEQSPLVKEAASGLLKEIENTRQRILEELAWAVAETGALMLLTVVTKGAASPALLATLRRIKQLKDLIQKVRRVYNVYTRVQQVIQTVQNAKEAYEQYKELVGILPGRLAVLQAKLEELEGEDELEEEIKKAEEQMTEEIEKLLEGKLGDLLEMFYIPDDTPVEELQTILLNIPKGIDALEDLGSFYGGANEGKEGYTEVLSVKAFKAGALLYPLVGFTAALVAEELQKVFPEKSLEDRLVRFVDKVSKTRQAKGGLKERNKGFFSRLNRKKYKFKESELETHLDSGKKELETLIDKDEPGGHWIASWFKVALRREVKTLNQKFRGKTVKATLKQKKGGAPSPSEETVPLPPFKVRVNRAWFSGKKVKAELHLNPKRPIERDELDNDDFKAGIPYAGTDKKRQAAIRKWLHQREYEFTHDNSAGEHIRLAGGTVEKRGLSYLKLESGKIYQGLEKGAYKKFLGKTITSSSDLPEGYHLEKQRRGYVVQRKSNLRRAGQLPELGLDKNRILKEGKADPVPEEVAKPDMVKPTKMEGYNWSGALDQMFSQGISASSEYNLQKKLRPAWDKLVQSQPELKQRPKEAKGRLGYILRARAFGDALGSRHLPELKKDDDKGHVVGKRFGGVDYYANLIPMKRELNQWPGKWYEVEKDMAEVFVGKKAQLGHYVEMDLTCIYPGSETRRPDKLMLGWKEKDAQGKVVGVSKSKVFDND